MDEINKIKNANFKLSFARHVLLDIFRTYLFYKAMQFGTPNNYDKHVPKSINELFEGLPQKVKAVFAARYYPNREQALELLSGSEISRLPDQALNILEYLNKGNKSWQGYTLSEQLHLNNTYIRDRIYRELKELPRQEDLIRKYFLDRDEWLKFAFNVWFLVNAGLVLEPYIVYSEAPPTLLIWLDEKFRVRPGDAVLHRHVISSNGRNRLNKINFPVPFDHLDVVYYQDLMSNAYDLIASNSSCKGLLSEGSWIFNSKNFENASDLKPFVSFTFLKDEHFVGDRLLIPIEEQEAYERQVEFATRNPRRKELYESGEFVPQTYGTFMPADILLEKFNEMRK